jgi:hypothetical protein
LGRRGSATRLGEQNHLPLPPPPAGRRGLVIRAPVLRPQVMALGRIAGAGCSPGRYPQRLPKGMDFILQAIGNSQQTRLVFTKKPSRHRTVALSCQQVAPSPRSSGLSYEYMPNLEEQPVQPQSGSPPSGRKVSWSHVPQSNVQMPGRPLVACVLPLIDAGAEYAETILPPLKH